MNYCAGIVTYNPIITELKRNIDGILFQVSLLIIFDNGSENYEEILKITQNSKKIILIRNIDNNGIAYALNRIFEYAIDHTTCKWVLTLDQDSICPINMIRDYSKYCNESIGIVSPLFRDPYVEYGISSLNDKAISVSHCITSGSLTNTKAWKLVGGFDETMFIDFVDYDFCYRIKEAGYDILQIPSVILDHSIGKSKQKNIFGKKIILSNHSNMRKYYIARNYLYYRHKNHITDSAQRRAMCNKIIKTLVFEKGRIGSMYAFFRGWIDGHEMIRGKEPKGWKN